jgi:hypothetical protein
MSEEFHVDPAWTVPMSKLSDFLERLRDICFLEATDRFEQIMVNINPNTIDKMLEDLGIENAEEEMKKTLRLQRTIALTRMGSDNPSQLAALCIDCHICIWLKGRKAFVVPFCTNFDFSKHELPDYADDYSCWSTGDMPDKMPKKVWNERVKNWKICFDELSSNRLINTVIEARESIGVSEITKKFSKEIKDAKNRKERNRLGESV